LHNRDRSKFSLRGDALPKSHAQDDEVCDQGRTPAKNEEFDEEESLHHHEYELILTIERQAVEPFRAVLQLRNRESGQSLKLEGGGSELERECD